MRRRLVLDAGVLALHFAGDGNAREYIDDVYKGVADAFMCEVNVAEFLYNYAKVFGWKAALVKHSIIRNSPIKVVGVDEELTLNASKIKLKYLKRLSLADSYLIALAKLKKATIVTTDHAVKEVNEVPTTLLPVP